MNEKHENNGYNDLYDINDSSETHLREKLCKAFDKIRADDELIQSTSAFLENERERRSRRVRRIMPRFAPKIAAALATVMVLAFGAFGYMSLYTAAYVSVEVNPSVELRLNGFDRVLDVRAINADGEDVLSGVNLYGKNYREAAAILWDAMQSKGYLDTPEPLVSLTVKTAQSREKELCDGLFHAMTAHTSNASNASIASTAQIEVTPISEQTYHDAHACRMGPAKYLAIQELIGVDDSATIEAYADVSIRQIRERTHRCRMGRGRGRGNGMIGGMGGWRMLPFADSADVAGR